jgi:hypothetical protein
VRMVARSMSIWPVHMLRAWPFARRCGLHALAVHDCRAWLHVPARICAFRLARGARRQIPGAFEADVAKGVPTRCQRGGAVS